MAKRTTNHRGGFTLIEASIGIGLLSIVLGTLALAMNGMRGLAMSSKERSAMQTSGQEALVEIIRDLGRSGIVAVDDVRFPVLFENGDPGELVPDHVHVPADEHAENGDPDFGPDREILFLLPRDEDGDRRPDIGEDGRLLWNEDVISYVVVTRQDGTNYLERRVNGLNPQVVALYVERVIFDDAASSGFEIPMGSIRVRLFLRKLDGGGTVRRHFTEGVVSLRNG